MERRLLRRTRVRRRGVRHKAAWARSRASPHEAGSRGDLGRDGERRGETGRDEASEA